MKYLSLFSGIGGFEQGIKQAYENYNSPRPLPSSEDVGHRSSPSSEGNNGSYQSQPPTCIGFSEINKYAVQIYQKHFPNHTNYGDITKIKEAELPDFDLLVGGFPCQSFSIAGKRGGFNDTRGTLFFEIARILKHKKPRLLLLENVKGLLSHDQGRTFATIISTLDELGYDLQWQVLNSKNHGVPQNRERVFIVGHLRGTARPKVFPFTGILRKDIEPQFVAPTVNTREGQDNGSYLRYEEGSKIRRLTPTECARLQGFPDNWHEGVSDTQAYKCYGNAVTVNVIQAIMERLLELSTGEIKK